MRPLIALTVLAVLLAGCTGGGDDDGGSLAQQAAELVQTGPTAEELARTPGSIEGVVQTASLAPIAGATVRLVRENATVVTDPSGFFRFANLATTTYLVEASADGYLTRTLSTSARNGTVVDLNITLDPAVIVAPHKETRELAGFLSCGARATTPEGDTHGGDCAAADPNHRDRFEFDVMPDGKLTVIELTWDTEANPGLPMLRLVAETVGYGAMDELLGDEVGEGYARVVVPQSTMEKYYPEGGRMRVVVSMAPESSTPPVAVAAQSSFTVFVTTFYVEPGSPDFAVVSA